MKYLHFCIVGCIAVFAGCYSVNSVQEAKPTAQLHTVADKRVVWDNTLNGKLAIGQIIEAVASSNLRKIQIDVANQYAYAIDFAYTIEWMDANGMKLTSPTGGWKLLHLNGHESSTISEIAITPDAHDFIIKFKETKGSNTIF
jgi:uncharacterized protein YcfL